MQTRSDFLRAIMPDSGVYVAVAIDGKRVAQTFHDTIEELETKLDTLSSAYANTFFAVASFKASGTRTTDNVNGLRALFVDLDCGADPENKKYVTQADAVAALREFVKDTKLPTPWVINSGRGIHAYWPFTEAVQRTQWKPVADKLKQLCAIKGFKADPAVTADAVRVLRVPGSFNVKDKDNPLPVEVLKVGKVTPFDDLRKLLGVSEFETAAVKRPMDEVTKNLLANRPSSFKDIVKRSVAGDGCRQILYAIEHQQDLPEPLWRAVLSVAQHCQDRDKAIHKVSSGHPGYDPEVTERKAQGTKGPYTCSTFQNIDATLCEGCPHLNKISSPIVLGMGRVLAAAPEDNVIEASAADDDRTVVYEIPEYPFPYFRGKNGGIYVRALKVDKETKQEEEVDELVYPYDFYLVSLIEDPHAGATGLFRVHFPQDGVKEFCLTLPEVLARDRFRDGIAAKGICPRGSQLDQIMSYANNWVNHYQKSKQAKLGRVQFGWADNNQCFIVGDREIRADEVRYSPPSASTVDLVPAFKPKGTLEGWRNIANYFTQPGMELQLFALLAGFASPIMPFTRTQGGIISLYSNKGGTGKTTTLWMINSIFGHPKNVGLIRADTVNSRINRVGVYNNIAATTDEITNETPENLSEFIYNMLHGRGKNRLRNSENVERINTTFWNNINVITGNATVTDKLFLKKDLPDGELRRLIEFEMALPFTISKAESDALFMPLFDNYGVAGEVYIQHMLQRMGTVFDTFVTIQRKLDIAAGLQQREQYLSATAAGILAAGVFVKDSGVMTLTNEDLKRLYQWVVTRLQEFKSRTATQVMSLDEVLGGFLSQHINDMLVIKGQPTNGLWEAPIKEPRGKLLLRYEPDTQQLCVNASKFREYCAERQVSYDGVLTAFKREKMYEGVTRKRLGKGTAISANERVLVFTNINKELVDAAEQSGSDGAALEA